MQFGYQNPSFNWPSGEYAIWEETKKAALWAEENGFDSFWLMDHFIQLPMLGEVDEPFIEGWTGIAALAAIGFRRFYEVGEFLFPIPDGGNGDLNFFSDFLNAVFHGCLLCTRGSHCIVPRDFHCRLCLPVMSCRTLIGGLV